MSDGDVRTVRSFCRICTSVCGILVDVAGDEVVRVRGDQDHPLSHGYTCAKGRALAADAPPPRPHRAPACCGSTANFAADHLGGVPRRPREPGEGDHRTPRARRRSASSSAAATAWTPPATGCRRRCSRRSARRPSSARSPSTAPPRCWCPISSAARSRSADGPTTTARRSSCSSAATRSCRTATRSRSRIRCRAIRELASRGRRVGRRSPPTETARLAGHHLAPRPGTDYAVLAFLVRELLRDGADRAVSQRVRAASTSSTTAVEPFTLEYAARIADVPTADLARAARRRSGAPAAWRSTPAPASRWQPAPTSRSGWRGR